jgi:hypothetical protein
VAGVEEAIVEELRQLSMPGIRFQWRFLSSKTGKKKRGEAGFFLIRPASTR